MASSPIRVDGHLDLAAGLDPADDAVDDPLDLLVVDAALAGGDADRAGELVTVERQSAPVLLHHQQVAQLHALEGGEAGAAGGALATPPDRCRRRPPAANP